MHDAPRRLFIAVITSLLSVACTGTILDSGAPASGDGGVTPLLPDAGATPTPDATPIPPDAQPTTRPLATGIHIREIAVYQGVKIPIARDGSAITPLNAPIVEGAEAMVGVFVDLDADWQQREVVARLTIDTGVGDAVEYEAARVVSSASGSDPVASGFSLQVAGADITLAASYRVEILEATPTASYPGSSDGARFPHTGDASLAVQSSNGALELVLVPFRYDADGSGRLPPVDESAVAVYREKFLAMYPVAEVNVTVREPVPYNDAIGATSGWNGWLDTLTYVREQDAPPANTYYYGVASPASSWNAFCSGGCIAGLGWVPGRDAEYLRAAVGVSFPDGIAVGTSLHEIGHTMGRYHTPCGNPGGIDPEYPYASGYVGVWGFDTVLQALKDPEQHTDIMGYCNNQWISDYTYEGIFERISYANQGFANLLVTPQRHRVGLVDGSGNIEWRRYMTPRSPIAGAPIRMSLLGADGLQRDDVAAQFFPYDHLEGGMILVPVPDGPPPVSVRAADLVQTAW